MVADASPLLRSSHRQRVARTDGDATRSHMIEAAGQVFAERGYADTTSKAICERAGVNIASVNYHFGSRDGLYLAVLKEVQQRILDTSFLVGLVESSVPASQKLLLFFEGLVASILDAHDWHVRVWAREILAPSQLLGRIMKEDTQPKFEALRAIVCEITGLPADAPELTHRVLSVAAPCLVLLIADRGTPTPIHPLFQWESKELALQLWQFALAGLEVSGRVRG